MSAETVPGIRARNRTQITAAIVAAAREQLGTNGPAGLSLRAVARHIDMAPSALYRYFPGRDDLLTKLIIDAYRSLADAATAAEEAVPRSDFPGRFRAVARAVRGWALAHEHEYALIYGTPVPGYRAPQDTVEPATRVSRLLVAIVAEARAAGAVPDRWPAPPDPAVRDMAPVLEFFRQSGADVPAALVLRSLMAWSQIYGTVSFELFGQLHNAVISEKEPDSPFFEAELDVLVLSLGLVATR